jgi:ubiquinone/menaquinone biosynthesis C-methylase UbiE
MVVSFDYSYAVEANYRSNGASPNVLIVQADVFAMPFKAGTFDLLFCFGMLQHTPNARGALAALPRVVKPGGLVCADIYKATLLRTMFHTKFLVRPFTRHLDPDRLYAGVCRWVDFMWPLAGLIRKLPKGHGINWRLMVADYSNLGLTGEKLKEWAYLDTFDMLAPHYDLHVRAGTFAKWGADSGLQDIETEYNGHGVVMRARVPSQ